MSILIANELLKNHMDSQFKVISDKGVESITVREFYEAITKKLCDDYPGILYEGEDQ